MIRHRTEKLTYVVCGLLSVVFVSACSLEQKAASISKHATQTSYRQQETLFESPGGRWDGYKDEKIDDLTYKIEAKGNGLTGPERVHDIALLRAAKLGEEKGFDLLIVQEASRLLGCKQGFGFHISELIVRYGNHDNIAGIGSVLSIPSEIERLEESLERPVYDARLKEKRYIENARACQATRSKRNLQKYGN